MKCLRCGRALSVPAACPKCGAQALTASALDRVVACFSEKDVDFMLVEGVRLLFDGDARNARDLGVLLQDAAENIERAMAAIREAGFGCAALTSRDFTDGPGVSLGEYPDKADILCRLPELALEEAWSRREGGVYGPRSVNYGKLETLLPPPPLRFQLLVLLRVPFLLLAAALAACYAGMEDAGRGSAAFYWSQVRVPCVAAFLFGGAVYAGERRWRRRWPAWKGLRASRGLATVGLAAVSFLAIFGGCAVGEFAVRTPRGDNEGASNGNLGAIRSALSIYYGDMEGQYPSDLAALTIGGKYLSMIPLAKERGYHPDALHRLLEGVALPPAVTGDYHPNSSAIHFGRVPDDSGGWLYNNVPGDANTGSVMYNCTHTDAKGSAWSSY